jgi:hypothetical protein
MYRTMVGILNNAVDPASMEVGLGSPQLKKTPKVYPHSRCSLEPKHKCAFNNNRKIMQSYRNS